MRKMGWFVTSVALILMAVALVEGQQGEKKKTGGGGKGGFGGAGGRMDPITLLNNASVKKELSLTDEQVAKLPTEVLAAIAKVLDEKQMKRFKQIELQQRGNEAFKDATVQKALNFTSDQKTKVDDILTTSAKELAEIKGGFGGGGNFKEAMEKRETIRKETTEKINTVLNVEQRKAWTEMLGEEFKIQRGGFGGGGGNKNKKKDTE